MDRQLFWKLCHSKITIHIWYELLFLHSYLRQMANYFTWLALLYMHIQINHLGHFFLCLELLPCMMSTEGDKRIVLVSSNLANSGVWDPDNLHGDSSYNRLKFYGNSKLYNISSWLAMFCCHVVILADHDSICTAEKSSGLWNNYIITTSRNSGL